MNMSQLNILSKMTSSSHPSQLSLQNISQHSYNIQSVAKLTPQAHTANTLSMDCYAVIKEVYRPCSHPIAT